MLAPWKKSYDKPRQHIKETVIPEDPICLLRNLYAGEEATIRIGHGTNGLVHNWEWSTLRLFYIVTLLI